MRARARFVAAGYATALLDDPRDVPAAVAALRALARPAFVVGPSNGTVVAAAAAAAPLSGAQAVAASLSGDVSVHVPASTARTSGDCDAASPHGYLGIQAQAVDDIVAWMKAHAAP